jgi:D-arabinose 1-dehydrogenase-like Zn-dependent alcohol dehydrogenase
MSGTPALSAPSVGAPFEHTMIERRALDERDVQIDVKYCCICAWES